MVLGEIRVITLPSSNGLLAGDLRIYSAPKALLRHIQWSLNEIFGYPVELNWEAQHLSPGALATQLQWRELKPVASKIASTLKSWHYLRFEVREFSNISGEGVLYRCTPDLGLHQAVTASTGDVMIHENRLVTILENSRSYETLRKSVSDSLGIAWDLELESYRRGVGSEGEIRAISI
ncbi:MAG: DUF3145 family protein [Actinomycetales bacterium]|nr:MAG: DUF3145 family protein [Actinomycetales bacterium]